MYKVDHEQNPTWLHLIRYIHKIGFIASKIMPKYVRMLQKQNQINDTKS